MPDQEICRLEQDAVLWPSTGPDRYGEWVVAATPVAVKVKWDYVSREVTDRDGNTVTIDATAVVDRPISRGSAMWLGKVSALPAGTGPPGNVMSVYSYRETQDLRGRAATRTVQLMRRGDTLPRTLP